MQNPLSSADSGGFASKHNRRGRGLDPSRFGHLNVTGTLPATQRIRRTNLNAEYCIGKRFRMQSRGCAHSNGGNRFGEPEFVELTNVKTSAGQDVFQTTLSALIGQRLNAIQHRCTRVLAHRDLEKYVCRSGRRNWPLVLTIPSSAIFAGETKPEWFPANSFFGSGMGELTDSRRRYSALRHYLLVAIFQRHCYRLCAAGEQSDSLVLGDQRLRKRNRPHTKVVLEQCPSFKFM